MVKNGLYNVIGALLRLGVSFLTIPLLTRWIGVEEFGLWTLVTSASALVALAEGGISVATTVFLARQLAHEDSGHQGIEKTLTVTGILIVCCALVAACVLAMGAPLLVRLFGGITASQRVTAVLALRLCGLIVSAQLLQLLLVSIEQAHQRYAGLSFLIALQAIVQNIGLLIVAHKGGRTVALVEWQVVATWALLCCHVGVCWQILAPLRLKMRWDKAHAMELLGYSSNAWVANIGIALFSKADRLVVGMFLPTVSVGIYSLITSITGLINQFSALPVQPLVPKMSGWLVDAKANHAAIQNLVQKAVTINTVVALGLGGGLFTFAPLLLNFVMPHYAPEALWSLRVATVIWSLYSLHGASYLMLFSLGEVARSKRIVLTAGALSLALIAVFSIVWGFKGAILGNAGYFCILFLSCAVRRRLEISNAVWTRWSQIPFLWFGGVILLNALIPPLPFFILGLLLVQCLVLALWIACHNQIGLRQFLPKLGAR